MVEEVKEKTAPIIHKAEEVKEKVEAAPAEDKTVTPEIAAPATPSAPEEAPAEIPEAAPAEEQSKESKSGKIVSDPKSVEPNWDDMETQRDIAFKIIYFFITFILATFGLLYLYYKMDKKEREQEEREKRAKGAFFGEVNNSTFFDFLAGQVDNESYMVNPNARTGGYNSTSIGRKNEEKKDFSSKDLEKYDQERWNNEEMY